MSIFIGIPTYDGKLHHTTVKGLMQTALFCGQSQIGIALEVIPHDAFIGRARNLIAKRFLDSNFGDLLFVDADIGFGLREVVALGKMNADIVVGLYRMKTEKMKYPAALFDPIERHPEDRNAFKLQYGPTGFMKIRRVVLETMMAKWPDEWYSDDNGRIMDFFPHGRVGNHFIGEDIRFCQRAIECGFDVFAYQGLTFSHTGDMTWETTWQLDVSVPVEEVACPA